VPNYAIVSHLPARRPGRSDWGWHCEPPCGPWFHAGGGALPFMICNGGLRESSAALKECFYSGSAGTHVLLVLLVLVPLIARGVAPESAPSAVSPSQCREKGFGSRSRRCAGVLFSAPLHPLSIIVFLCAARRLFVWEDEGHRSAMDRSAAGSSQ
jgi:hypothetical protein